MFPGRIRNPSLVAAGLPSLRRAMIQAQINTPPRIAALLATLDAESYFEYNILQGGSNVPTGLNATDPAKNYTGRGFIQLTTRDNYEAAGKYFGIDLLNHPELAQSLEWSAQIVKWYWTVNRNINPLADGLQMGKVNRAIGYPLGDGKADQRRCASFTRALQYLTGSVPTGITCTR